MILFSCFSTLAGKKKKMKDDGKVSLDKTNKNGLRSLQVKLEHPTQSSDHTQFKSTSLSVSVPFEVSEDSTCKVKVMNPENPVEVTYDGEDERDDKSIMKRDDSDYEEGINNYSENKSEEDSNKGSMNVTESGHVSDPGMAREEQWASPKLKRSCSSLDTREVLKKIGDRLAPPSKCQSYEQLQKLAEKVEKDVLLGSPCSQASAISHHSADKVMLRRRSSSQILPSRSRKLWWKLFLWSHRNLQKPKSRVTHLASINQQGGYSSDTLETGRLKQVSQLESPASFSEICSYKSGDKNDMKEERWKGFKDGGSGLWPQNQWVAFSGESSPLKRVEDWVKHLDIQSGSSSIEEENCNEQIYFPPSPEGSKLLAKGVTHVSKHSRFNLSEELLHANSVIQSLNSSSTVAHISGVGLKAIPIISQFSSLRSVNLSNNSIAQITPGSLPKGLHVLNLSKNKISVIEGLRELTRLRVLDLSYNRIFRTGHGLANCALLKELYLAGNKISEVEGLHRLLKLTVLDLSFNKISTTKALGQLVANYNSLLALNLLGNPIQSNLSDDQLRKAVCGLLPKMAYLNKQPVNPQKAREVSIDIIAKASSRSTNSRSVHRRSGMKTSQSRGSLSSAAVRSNTSVVQKSKNKLRSRANQPSTLKTHA